MTFLDLSVYQPLASGMSETRLSMQRLSGRSRTGGAWKYATVAIAGKSKELHAMR